MFKIIIFVLIALFVLTGCSKGYEQHRSCGTAVHACERLEDITDFERLECFKSAFTNVCKTIPDEPFIQIGRKEKYVN